MHHFRRRSTLSKATRNRPPPEPTSPIEHMKKEFTTHRPRIMDYGVLATLSPPRNPGDAAPNEPEPPEELRWTTAYEKARMAVELAMEPNGIFLLLEAVVGALSLLVKSYGQTRANAEQIEDIEDRMQSLGGVFASQVDDQESEEKVRREVLIGKLAGIIVGLAPFPEQHGLKQFLNDEDHIDMLTGFVDDLGHAISDYQMSVRQIIHENMRVGEDTGNTIDVADIELLGKLNPVHNVGYQASHHETCLPGTRESVLDTIMQWAKNPQERQVFWLGGLAGTGKSTIAQTSSGMLADVGILGASFFCSRDYLDRKELKNLFPTLAYQLACQYPSFRSRLVRVLKRDPSAARSSLISQLKDLIIDPLSSTDISCVIVIDALDECIDEQPAPAILSVLGRYVKLLPSVKFFITGRPEPRIGPGFRLPLLEPFAEIFLLYEIEISSVDDDIRLYFRQKLSAVAKQSGDFDPFNPWPHDDDVATLTKKSSGFFIFASTLVRFIESEHRGPGENLQLVIPPLDSTIREGRARIDPLYTQVLTHAFQDVRETTAFEDLRRVLGAVILAFNPLSQVQIANILNIDASLIATTLLHLHSVLLVPTENSKEIRIFHKSFPDFLQDRDRCSNSNFLIDSPLHHADMALGCLKLLKKLKPNPCDLPDYAMNQDVPNLPELLEDKVGSATRYACEYWAMHTRSSPTSGDYAVRLVDSAIEFFKSNAVPWIEIMSLENRLESVIHSIYNVLDWIGTVNVSTFDLRKVAEDCLRFTLNFFPLIQQSAPHAYHSALPLSPWPSTFRPVVLWGKTLITGFFGRPTTWGAVVRTIKASSERFTCTTTLGRWIAAACGDGTVNIYDTVTGVLRLSITPTEPVQAMRGSQDGSVLFCTHQEPSITLWDIQTGGLIFTFALKWTVEDIAISSKGRYFACGLPDGSVKVWEVASRREGAGIGKGSGVPHLCWLESEERLVVAKKSSVRIRNAVSGAVLQKFKMEDPVSGVAYSQKFDKLAIVTTSGTGSTVTIFDPQSGSSSAPSKVQHRLYCFAFSQIAEMLVCGTKPHGLGLLNIWTHNWKHSDHPATLTSIFTLSNGTVVANVAGVGIQLLNLDQGYTPSRQFTVPALTVDALDEGRIIVVLPTSCDYIAFLESGPMWQLHKIPAQGSLPIPTDRPGVLSASLKNGMAVYCFEEGDRGNLQLWKFGRESPEWTVTANGQPIVGGISPGGARLLTLHNADRRSHIYMWNARNGELLAHLPFDQSWPTYPLEFKFQSEDQFSSQDETYRIHNDTSSSGTPGYSIIRSEEIPSVGQRQRSYYVDDAREWVIGFSKRICWIPAGYIGSVQRSYCWIGNTLVMAGQDGTLRKLNFREPSQRIV